MLTSKRLTLLSHFSQKMTTQSNKKLSLMTYFSMLYTGYKIKKMFKEKGVKWEYHISLTSAG